MNKKNEDQLQKALNYLENHTILLNQFAEQPLLSNIEKSLNYLENQTALLNQHSETLNQLLDQGVKSNSEKVLNYLENQTVLLSQHSETLNQLLDQGVKSNSEKVLNYLENQSILLTQLVQNATDNSSNQEKLNQQILGSLAVNGIMIRQQRNYDVDFDLAGQTKYKKATHEEFEKYILKLKKLMPDVFEHWLKCFETGSAAYQKDPHGSCSVWGEKYAEGFRNFCSGFLKGRVLDVGSGPIGKPVYLQGYPSSLISAVEPLEVEANVDFELVRSFNEFLPWPDKSFNTVINATSLDHVLSLDIAMEETHRVLTDDGRFIIWIGSIPGATPYEPKKKGFKPIDDFHLFHIDQKWFDLYLVNWFEIEEKLEFPNQSFSHIYYVLSKKKS